MSFITDALGVVGKAAGSLIPGLGDAVKLVTGAIKKDPAIQKAVIDQEVEFRKMAMQEGDSIRKMYGLEIQSEDKFIRRVRPALVWVVIGILSMNFILLPIINMLVTVFGGFHDVVIEGVIHQVANVPQIVLIYPVIPESILALFGTIFFVYAGARSFDKKTKAGK